MPRFNIELAMQVRDLLCQQNQRIVLAESCTAGRVAGTLAVLPGISQWMCGSFVVYRNASKSAWLGVPTDLLGDPAAGPVSRQVTEFLASAALQRTPEAEIALSVTGDIGPGAPTTTDGIVFTALKRRNHSEIAHQRIQLSSPPPCDELDIASRIQRLDEATGAVLSFAIEQLMRSMPGC